MRLAGHAISTCVPKLLVYPPVSSGVNKHGTGKSPINGGGLSIGLVGYFLESAPFCMKSQELCHFDWTFAWRVGCLP